MLLIVSKFPEKATTFFSRIQLDFSLTTNLFSNIEASIGNFESVQEFMLNKSFIVIHAPFFECPKATKHASKFVPSWIWNSFVAGDCRFDLVLQS